MAILWDKSLIPWTDANGDPYSGAKAYFFDADTTTPQAVYTDAALSIPHDHPVVADSAGQFPAVFMQQGTYRLRITTSADVTFHDVDNITVPVSVTPTPPSGDVDLELLHQTGDIKTRYGSGSHTGWVRVNGRTIGNASSGATERANADCEDLFVYLWDTDAGLTVSGGRGASGAADFAANKTIALPDARGRVLAGLVAMGNSDAGIISSGLVDGGDDADDLGATAGQDDVTLSVSEIPSHNHGGVTNTTGAHTHAVGDAVLAGGPSGTALRTYSGVGTTANSTSNGDHAHTISSQGGGGAHTNMQPTMFLTLYMKL